MVKTKSIKTSFIGSHGNRLDARLELPEGDAKAFIIFSHCFTCTKDIITVYRSSRMLAQHGYAVLRFDFSGLGNSEGDFADSNFSTTIEDINAALLGGAKEIILTGVHLGSWGYDFNDKSHIKFLIEKILQMANPPRIRISSLEQLNLLYR